MPFSRAKERFSQLEPLGGGYYSRVYASGDTVLKIYKARNGLNQLEADMLRRVGLGQWVIDTFELDPVEVPELQLTEPAEVLRMKRFAGLPLRPEDILSVLPALSRFLRHLHSIHGPPVDLAALRDKLERFDQSLQVRPERSALEPLFVAVRSYLERADPARPSSLCHLDLWYSNVLFAPPDQVLVVDWHKADFDDPARDYALFFTGTLELLPLSEARVLIEQLSDAEGLTSRLVPYIALTTLHDLYWFLEKQPEGFRAALDAKLPRTLAMLS